jgi:transposase
MRVAPQIILTDEERSELTGLVRSKLTSVRLTQRARIVLLAAEGWQNKDIAAELGVGRVQVSRWRERYLQSRRAGIERDLPRGAPSVKVDVARLVELTTQSKPKAATHWSTRTMAAMLGISAASVSRHWRANGLKPHLVRGFKVSRDPKFVEKLEDIVGLYLSPPEHALVLCCDEKSQVQALDRTQPGRR